MYSSPSNGKLEYAVKLKAMTAKESIFILMRMRRFGLPNNLC